MEEWALLTVCGELFVCPVVSSACEIEAQWFGFPGPFFSGPYKNQMKTFQSVLVAVYNPAAECFEVVNGTNGGTGSVHSHPIISCVGISKIEDNA